MTRLSIKTRLLLLILLTAFALVGLRYDGYVSTRRMADAARELYDTQVVPLEAALAIRDQMRHDLLDVPLRVKLGLMSPQQASAAVSRTAAGLATKWERFQTTATAPRLRQTVVTAEPLVARAEAAAPRLAAILAGGGGPALDEVLREVHPLVEEFDNEFTQASSLVRDEAGRRYQETQARYRRGILFSTILAALTLALVLGIGWSIGRTLVSALAQVQESGARVTSSSTQLAASSRQLESVIAQQVASTTQVEGTAHQIASTAASLSGTMQEISRRADDAQATARRGFDGLKRIGQAMGGMDAATSLVSDRLATINAKAANITGVVTTITKVADQTNLLSLNASIEAVKAGELGHGFGVVAQEIRRLADQTAVATLDIEQIVKEMQAAVASGVMGMDKLAEQVREAVDEVSRFSVELRRGIEDVTALIQRFGTFNEGMASQSAGARDISQALSQLSTGAAETSRTLKDSLHVAAQLDETARRLSDEVAGFGMA